MKKKLMAGTLGVITAASIMLGLMNQASGDNPAVPTIPEGESTSYPAPAHGPAVPTIPEGENTSYPAPAHGDVLFRSESGDTITVNLDELDRRVTQMNRTDPPPAGHYYSYGVDDSGNPVRQLLCVELSKGEFQSHCVDVRKK